MITSGRYLKTIRSSGTSLIVTLTPEARNMGLKDGDDVLITIDRLNNTGSVHKGYDALRMLDCGRMLHSDMGGGVTIRLNGKTKHLEALHEGQLPVAEYCLDSWVRVSMDVNALYKFEWTVVEE